MSDLKWYSSEKQPPTQTPIIFTVNNQEIEGWYIYNRVKECYFFVREKTGGGWDYFEPNTVNKWRRFGIVRSVE